MRGQPEEGRELLSFPAALTGEERRAGRLDAVLPLASIAVAIAALLGFSAVGRSFYDDYRLPQGSGMYHLLPEELAFYALFFVFGGTAVAGLWLALRATRIPQALIAVARRAAGAGWMSALALCLTVAVLCALIRSGVLHHAVISDDEHAYQFIAQTLRRGALTTPSPGSDLAFFREQFVVLTPAARFGKYPIGHPLALAVGQALGLEPLVVPILTAGVGALVYAIGRVVGGAGVAYLSTLLFVTSPQVLFTGATLLSQPTAALCLGAAVVCLLAAEDKGARSSILLVGAGAALAFGILARPLPVVLFVPVAALFALGRPPYARPAVARRLVALLAPVAMAVVVMLLVNRAQVGHALVTAYAESLVPGQGPGAILVTTSATFAMRAMSLVGSLIRLNFWLFGWPVSLLLCLLASRTRTTGLLGGMVLASLAYRLITPKVGVGGAGPIYFFEVVPLLCVLTADGALRMVRAFPRPILSAGSLAALLLAAQVANLTLFLPSRLADLRRMGAAQNLVDEMIHDKGASRALLFHEGVVPWWTRSSWAYYPRINSPGLDDDVLFVLLQRAHGLQENVEFWKRRYPERSAWYFGYSAGGPMLVPLEPFVQGAAGGAPATRADRPSVSR
jgi:dolichyl-phosphate-mannose-protein mannosyltransferase